MTPIPHGGVRMNLNSMDPTEPHPGMFSAALFRPSLSQLDQRRDLPNATPATHFLLSEPAFVQANKAFNLTVTAETASNKAAGSFNGTVQFSTLVPDTGALGLDDYTFTASDHGTHTFKVTLTETLQTQSIVAMDGNLVGMATNSVAPSPEAPTRRVAGESRHGRHADDGHRHRARSVGPEGAELHGDGRFLQQRFGDDRDRFAKRVHVPGVEQRHRDVPGDVPDADDDHGDDPVGHGRQRVSSATPIVRRAPGDAFSVFEVTRRRRTRRRCSWSSPWMRTTTS